MKATYANMRKYQTVDYVKGKVCPTVHTFCCRVKPGSLEHGSIQDSESKAVSTTRYTLCLVSVASMFGSSAVASVARQLNHSRSKGAVLDYPLPPHVPNYPALPYTLSWSL